MAPGPAADGERILLLECRLEQLRSGLDLARADADSVRVKLAEAAAREADHARRYGLIQQELADARAEIASVHERLDRSEALRAELQGHLFEAGARGDAAELVRLRREILAQRQRSVISERTCTRLRARVDELLLSRETLLTRVAEWQRLVQKEGPAAADLAEFMAELRGDILQLEHRNAAGERQEAALRDRLVRAGLDADGPAAENVPAALLELGYDELVPEPLPLEGEAQGAAAPADDPPGALTTGTPEAAKAKAAVPKTATAEDMTPETAMFAAAATEDNGTEAAEKSEAETTELDSSPQRGEAGTGVGAGVRAQPARPDPASAEPVDAAPAQSDDEDRTADSTGSTPTPEAKIEARIANPVNAGTEPTAVSITDTATPFAAEREDQTGGAGADAPPVEGLHAADPSARAAAYERLTRVLESDPARLAQHLRPGLADPHPRVRRRAVLAAATAQRLPLHGLLEPLQRDPDPHVRRVVREVLRHASRAELRTEDEDDAVLPPARVLSKTRS